jgi:serine phosphatase RsbU (regulator of sigma subunit)
MELRHSWRPGHALVGIPLVLILLIAVAENLVPRGVQLGPLLVVVPAITASFAGPRMTAAIALLALVTQLFINGLRGGVTTLNYEVQIITLLTISAFVVVFSYLRERRARELAQVRSVSDAAQRVVLRPLPRRIGPLRIASVYLAADAEARIGGDLYAAARTTRGTRLIIGDVRGKGLTSISDAALLLCAFREAAHRHAALPALMAYLEASVSRNLAELTETDQDVGEFFVTAALLEIPDDEPVVRLIDCGHPPPLLLLRERRVTTLQARRPVPPLGLGELSECGYPVETFPLGAGDLLVLYTDGVIEARDPAGTFFPLADRILAWSGGDPESLVQHIRDDLLTHVRGELNDDAAVIVLERTRPGLALPA